MSLSLIYNWLFFEAVATIMTFSGKTDLDLMPVKFLIMSRFLANVEGKRNLD